MNGRFAIKVMILALSLEAIAPQRAHAFRGYFEMGAGATWIMGGDPLLGASATGLSYSVGYTLGLAFELTNTGAPVRIDLGAQGRIAQGTQSTTYYGMRTLYPLMRAHIRSIYLGFGATPWIWSRSGDAPDLITYDTVTGSIAYLGQLGYQYHITPMVHFVVEGSGQFVSTATGLGPAPSLELIGMLRLFIGGPKTNVREAKRFGDGVNAKEYEGWRYPFGQSR